MSTCGPMKGVMRAGGASEAAFTKIARGRGVRPTDRGHFSFAGAQPKMALLLAIASGRIIP